MDLGAAYGHQSECALNEGIDYLGVDDAAHKFWNADTFTFLTARYPAPLPLEEGDLGVSVLCLTWPCYLTEGVKTLHEQCAALAKDFKHCVLYVETEGKKVLEQYFETVTQIDRSLYYFQQQTVLIQARIRKEALLGAFFFMDWGLLHKITANENKGWGIPKRRKEKLEENRKQIGVASGYAPDRRLTEALLKELKGLEIVTDKRRTEIKE